MRRNSLAAVLVASCVLAVGFSVLSSPVFGQCSNCTNPGYTRMNNRERDPSNDVCGRRRDSTCYDCVAQCSGEWVHCAENEPGTEATCRTYTDFSSIPGPGQTCGSTVCDPFVWVFYFK